MRHLTADYIFPVSGPPIKNGVVTVDDTGYVIAVSEYDLAEHDTIEVEYHQGVICPGFINAHCHLELSHLEGKIPEKTGLPGFLGQVIKLRASNESEIMRTIEQQDHLMWEDGIVAVGDISNTNHTFRQKAQSPISYYTFIEAFDFLPQNAQREWDKALALGKELERVLPTANYSIVPHAPYSVSDKLFKLMGDLCYDRDGVISLHNQETPSENEMHKDGKGALLDLFNSLGIDLSNWKATGFNSLPSVAVHLPKCVKILLVHNTYTTKEDIRWAHAYSKMMYWCFCPNANLYIENSLPDIPTFIEEDCKCVLGTDSLSSNHQLSILEEMKTITAHFPNIPFTTQLQWATKNGAELLGFQHDMGTLEPGKLPGVVVIDGFDLNGMKLTKHSTARKIA